MTRALRISRSLLSTLAIVAAFATAAMMLLPALLGFERYVITGGSMAGTLDRGSIAFDRPVPVADLRVGDVITYRPPPGTASSALVTHRIVWAGRDRNGHRTFRTKGDANRAADPWRFTLTRPTQARVAFHVPYAGYPLAALAVRPLRMLLIGLPALMIGIAAAARLWRDPEADDAAVAEAAAA